MLSIRSEDVYAHLAREGVRMDCRVSCTGSGTWWNGIQTEEGLNCLGQCGGIQQAGVLEGPAALVKKLWTDLVLQEERNVMGLLHRHLGGQQDLQLHNESRAKVIGSNAVHRQVLMMRVGDGHEIVHKLPGRSPPHNLVHLTTPESFTRVKIRTMPLHSPGENLQARAALVWTSEFPAA